MGWNDRGWSIPVSNVSSWRPWSTVAFTTGLYFDPSFRAQHHKTQLNFSPALHPFPEGQITLESQQPRLLRKAMKEHQTRKDKQQIPVRCVRSVRTVKPWTTVHSNIKSTRKRRMIRCTEPITEIQIPPPIPLATTTLEPDTPWILFSRVCTSYILQTCLLLCLCRTEYGIYLHSLFSPAGNCASESDRDIKPSQTSLK